MKRHFIFMMMTMVALNATGQEDKSVQLKEVTVEAARIVNKADGQLIMPSEAQKKASVNGYGLLAKLALPTIRVNEMMHSITALGNQGEVQIRLNGALATSKDLLALDPKTVKNIDFIDNPGVRYGTEIAYVINIHTRKGNEGYVVGVNLVNALTTKHSDETAYFKLNHKNSEFGFTYDFNFQDFRGDRFDATTRYLLNDNTYYNIERKDVGRRSRSFENQFEFKYILADSATYVFQASLSNDLNHHPGDFVNQQMIDEMGDFSTSQLSHGKTQSPILDLYFFHQLGAHQSLTANVVGTHIGTDEYNYNDEGTPYAYSVDGKTWSLLTETIYENRLKPFTLSFGLKTLLKYTSNAYTGDVNSLNGLHNSNPYLFGELKGKLSNLGYVAGLGVSNQRYSQEGHHYDFWMFRPKMTLSYPLLKNLRLRYMIEFYEHVSQVAMISDTRIRTNKMEWTVGNPNINPNPCVEQLLRLSYVTPRLTNNVDVVYRQHHNPNMASYSRTDDNQFLYTQRNQRHINMFYVQDDTRYDLIPEHLSLSFYGGIYRYFNRGDDYNHTLTAYNIGSSMEAFLGRWTFSATADNGWKFMEGETWHHQGAASYLTASCHIGQCDLSLFWQMPFQKNPKMNEDGLVNQYIQRHLTMRGTDYGNMVMIRLAWKLSHGRKYKTIEKRLQNKDTQTGILQ
jgi:hypothetical protein